MALDFVTQSTTGRAELRFAIGGVSEQLSRRLMFLQAQLLMPYIFLQSRTQPPAFNGRSIHRGFARHRMYMQFDTGDLAEINTTMSIVSGQRLQVIISIQGSVPDQPASLSVTGFSGDEFHARMSPSEWTFLSDRASYRMSNGNRVGVQWSQALQCRSSLGSAATCQENNVRQQVFALSRQIRSSYNAAQQLFIITSQTDSHIFPGKKN